MENNKENNAKPTLPLLVWAEDEYEERPLAFLKLDEVPDDIIVRLIRQVEYWYGNTDQDVAVWAVEFQLFVRMLVCDNALLLNPLYLDLTDVEEELCYIVGDIGNDAGEKYRQARAIPESEIVALGKSGGV